MDLNTLITVGCLALVGAFAGLQLWMRNKSSKIQGEPAPELAGPLGEAVRGSALLFFHSPGCAPCRAMHPQVDELARQDPRVHSVDVSQNIDAARAFGLMGTPTVVTVVQGKVQTVKVGAISNTALRALLKSLDPTA